MTVHCGVTLEEEHWRNTGGGTLEEEHWRRNTRGGTLEEQHWRRNNTGGGTLEEQHWRRNTRGGTTLEEEHWRNTRAGTLWTVDDAELAHRDETVGGEHPACCSGRSGCSSCSVSWCLRSSPGWKTELLTRILRVRSCLDEMFSHERSEDEKCPSPSSAAGSVCDL